MSTDPEQIREDIERTRAELSSDVDALTDKVSPSQVVHRQTEASLRVAANLMQAAIVELFDRLERRTLALADDFSIQDALSAHRLRTELDRDLGVKRSHIAESAERQEK